MRCAITWPSTHAARGRRRDFHTRQPPAPTITETTMNHAVRSAEPSRRRPPISSAVKARQQAAWSSGDYAVVGTTLQIVGEMLCEAVDLRSGQRVLDVAAGNGNATLAAARRFAEVVSTDYVGALLERGRERAEAERLPVTFQEADAENLPFADSELRCRALDLRRHVHAEPGTGREGTASRLPPRRQDRPCQLDAGRLHRPAVQDHRQIRAAGAGREVAGAVGQQGPSRRAVRPEGAIVTAQSRIFVFRYKSPAHWVEIFRTYLRPGAEGVRGDRRRRRARRSRPISTR